MADMRDSFRTGSGVNPLSEINPALETQRFEEIRQMDRENGIISEPVIIHDETDMAAFHKMEEQEEESSNRGMILGGVAAALLLGAVGFYGYTTYMHQPQQAVPAQVIAKAPPPAPAPQLAEQTTTPDVSPAAPEVAAAAPVASPTRLSATPRVKVPKEAPADAMPTSPNDMAQQLPTPPAPPSSSVAALPTPAAPDTIIQPTPDQTDTQPVPAIQQPQQQATPAPVAPTEAQPQTATPPATGQIVPEQPVQQ